MNRSAGHDAIMAEIDTGDPRYRLGVRPSAHPESVRARVHREPGMLAEILDIAARTGRRRAEVLAAVQGRHDGRGLDRLTAEELRAEWHYWAGAGRRAGPGMSELVTRRQAAELVDRTYNTVFLWERRGAIVPRGIGAGGRVLYDRSEVLAALEAQTAATQTQRRAAGHAAALQRWTGHVRDAEAISARRRAYDRRWKQRRRAAQIHTNRLRWITEYARARMHEWRERQAEQLARRRERDRARTARRLAERHQIEALGALARRHPMREPIEVALDFGWSTSKIMRDLDVPYDLIALIRSRMEPTR